MRPELCTSYYVVLHAGNFSIQEKSPWNYSWLKISKFQIFFFEITRFHDQFQNQPTNSLAFFLFCNAGDVGMPNKVIFVQFSLKAACLLDIQATHTIAKTKQEWKKGVYSHFRQWLGLPRQAQNHRHVIYMNLNLIISYLTEQNTKHSEEHGESSKGFSNLTPVTDIFSRQKGAYGWARMTTISHGTAHGKLLSGLSEPGS